MFVAAGMLGVLPGGAVARGAVGPGRDEFVAVAHLDPLLVIAVKWYPVSYGSLAMTSASKTVRSRRSRTRLATGCSGTSADSPGWPLRPEHLLCCVAGVGSSARPAPR
jgi:hypothetical protein